MQRHHTGSGRRRPVPQDWGAVQALVVGRSLPSTVRIGTVSTQPQWNPVTRQSESGALAPVYTGPASVMATAGDSAPVVVEDETSVRVYEITLSLLQPGADQVEAGHAVVVDASDDAALVGRRLQVQNVERGSRRFSRVLLATLLDG